MYRGRLWTMRQYAGMGDAEESNKRYRYLLANGTTGLSVAFDLPTQIGLDSDHPLAGGEVGKVGVAIDSIEDMERLFDGIDLTKISTSMTINATASILLALYVAVARRRGADIHKLSGTVQNDVLKEYIARGTYIYRMRCRISTCSIRRVTASRRRRFLTSPGTRGTMRKGAWPANTPKSARRAFTLAEIKHWLGVFLRRFFEMSQFKRSALPNGPKISSGGSLSPRGDWRAPSDSHAAVPGSTNSPATSRIRSSRRRYDQVRMSGIEALWWVPVVAVTVMAVLGLLAARGRAPGAARRGWVLVLLIVGIAAVAVTVWQEAASRAALGREAARLAEIGNRLNQLGTLLPQSPGGNNGGNTGGDPTTTFDTVSNAIRSLDARIAELQEQIPGGAGSVPRRRHIEPETRLPARRLSARARSVPRRRFRPCRATPRRSPLSERVRYYPRARPVGRAPPGDND